MKKTISVIGGDLRALTLAGLLAEDGYSVRIFGFDKDIDTAGLTKAKNMHDALMAEVIILPIPASSDNVTINAPYAKEQLLLDDFLAMIGATKLVLAGHIPPAVAVRFDREGIAYIDYYNREELMVKNAVPTAEGAIGIALSEMPVTLSGAEALVIGYGRIGKILTKLLTALGAKVTVSARRWGDLAWIEGSGARAVNTAKIADGIELYDVIFNTVPSLVLGENELAAMNKNTLIIDLASVPGGVDLETAKSLKRRVIWALSLPGKTAPISAGRIIKDTVKNILSELEVG
ncbi:MAG: dipicolinate synthase subunit DpsA [Clostridia bacterium]|nr:dipicolinate synthase subunit DpsA [Clostridia bacterium]